MGLVPGARRLARTPIRGSAVLAALLALACGGGGGGGDDTPTCMALSFDRALTTPVSGDVYLDQAGATCSSISINVLANGINGIWTTSFDIDFPSAYLSFDSFTPGPLFQKGNPANAPVFIVNAMGGKIEVTITRLAPDPPVDAVGSESIITLRFDRVGPGAGAIDFHVSSPDPISEVMLDDDGASVGATFSPGRGGIVTVP